MPFTGFDPMVHGFHFTNQFVNHIVLAGRHELVTYGRCGGMSFAALDYYIRGTPAPQFTPADFQPSAVPPDSHPLGAYLLQRQIGSMLTASAIKYVTLSLHADHKTWFFPGVWGWTWKDELPAVEQRLAQGSPVALGLLQSRNLDELSLNHVVVAYGYDIGPDEHGLYIYDPNQPDKPDALRVSNGGGPVRQDSGPQWRGFFALDYVPQTPPPFGQPMANWTAPIPLGDDAGRVHRIAAASNSDGRLEAFGVGLDQTSWHCWQTQPSGPWAPWSLIDDGTGRLLDIAAARNGDGRLEAFGVGLDQSSWHAWQESPAGGWTPWVLLDDGSGRLLRDCGCHQQRRKARGLRYRVGPEHLALLAARPFR